MISINVDDNSLIMTTNGFRRISDIRKMDEYIGILSNNGYTPILGLTEKYDTDIYEYILSTGFSLKCAIENDCSSKNNVYHDIDELNFRPLSTIEFSKIFEMFGFLYTNLMYKDDKLNMVVYTKNLFNRSYAYDILHDLASYFKISCRERGHLEYNGYEYFDVTDLTEVLLSIGLIPQKEYGFPEVFFKWNMNTQLSFLRGCIYSAINIPNCLPDPYISILMNMHKVNIYTDMQKCFNYFGIHGELKQLDTGIIYTILESNVNKLVDLFSIEHLKIFVDLPENPIPIIVSINSVKQKTIEHLTTINVEYPIYIDGILVGCE